MKLYILVALVFVSLTGCFSIKSEYPEIVLYRLNQEPSIFQNIPLGTIKGTLLMRDFTCGDELDAEQFTALWTDTKVQRYYYHRWIASATDLITDFFIQRYSNLNVFSGGAVKSSSSLLPDYILEGHLMELIAHNSESDLPNSNYVTFSIRIALMKRTPLSTEKNILVNKVYNVKVPRTSYKVETIAPAFSKAVSQAADNIMFEIQEAITKDRTGK